MAAMTREFAVKEQVKFEETYLKICFFKKKKERNKNILPLVPFTGILKSHVLCE